MDLKEIKIGKTPAKTASTQPLTSSVALKSDVVFKTIADRINENIERAKSINGVFLYNITKDGQIAKKWSEYSSEKRITLNNWIY